MPRLARLIPIAVATVAVSACANAREPALPVTPAPTANADAVDPAAPPPKPDAANEAAYLAALKRISPELVAGHDEATMVNRGRDVCTSVQQWPDDNSKLLRSANQRFTSPLHPEGFGDATASKILAAVRTYICPTA
jgi:uncharacterized protein DUF732